MDLTEKQKSLLEQRKRLLRIWPLVGSSSIALLIGLVVLLFAYSPSLINPVFVIAELEKGTLPKSSMELMAAILPIMVLSLIFSYLLMIVIAWVTLKRERRYIEIIESSLTGSD